MATKEKKKFKQKVNDRIDKEIDHLLACMAQTEPGSKEYLMMSANLERLQKLKDAQSKFTPSSDALLSAGVTVGCVLLILGIELGGGLFTTKASSFIPKPKF